MALLKLLGIKSALSTTYHPQTDGTTECVNQEIEAYLFIYCASHPEDWPQALHTMEFTHNNQQHADRQQTLFKLMFGESPVAIPLAFENTKYPSIEEKMTALLHNRKEALAAHELARHHIADRRKSTFTPFKKGDRVWLDSRNLKTIYHKKMKPRREGPFNITEVLEPVTYRLKLPTTWRIYDVFNAALLKPYRRMKSMGKTSQNHHWNLLKEKRSMKLKTFSIIGKEDENTNTMSNVGIPYLRCLMPSRMMVTRWHNTNFSITFNQLPTPCFLLIPFTHNSP